MVPSPGMTDLQRQQEPGAPVTEKVFITSSEKDFHSKMTPEKFIGSRILPDSKRQINRERFVSDQGTTQKFAADVRGDRSKDSGIK